MPLDGEKLDRAIFSAAALTTRLALFQTRADADPKERWITMRGSHVLIKGKGREASIEAGLGGKKISEPTKDEPKKSIQKLEPLNSKEEKALNEYGAGHSYNVNRYLRDPRLGRIELRKYAGSRSAEAISNMEKNIKTLDRIIEKSKLEKPQKLYRGVSDWSHVEDAIKNKDDNGEIQFKTFLSTSRSSKWADDFVAVKGGNKSAGGMITIDAPEGSNALDVGKASRFGDEEQEMLLGRNSKFRVKSYNEKTRELYLELVKDNTLRADATWNEGDHPRAEDGKFGSGAGAGVGGAKGLDYKSLKRIGPQLGSNPGGRFATPEGKSFYVKQSKSNDHAKNEVTAARLYELAGSPVLRSEPVEMPGGKLGTATEWKDVKNIDRKSPAEVKEAQKDFATHVWLANWDSIGLDYDNQGKIGGKMTTLDVGGSLLYRAQGAPKGDAFGTSAKEWDSLRDPSNRQAHRIFGDMSPEALRESARRVAAVPDDAIRRVVEESGPGSPEAKKALADLLIARKADIAKRAGLDARNDAATVPEGKIRVSADDAGWKEADHPRDADGKFSSTGGSGAAKKGLSDYKSSLSKNAKGSTLGMIKHMLMTGKFSEKDIIDAAVEGFGLTPDKFSYVKFGFKDLQKTGKAPPPIPEKSEFEEPEAKDPGDKIVSEKELENFKLHEPAPVEDKLAKKVKESKIKLVHLANDINGITDVSDAGFHISNVLEPKIGFGGASKLGDQMGDIEVMWDSAKPDIKSKIEVGFQKLAFAVSLKDENLVKNAIAQLPFEDASESSSLTAYNNFLKAAKEAYSLPVEAPKPEAPPPEAPKTDPAKEALKSASQSPPKTAADVDGLKNHISAFLKKELFDKEKPDTYFSVKNEINALVDNWDKIFPENQKAVAAQLQMIGAALSFPNDIGIKDFLTSLKPLPGGGLAKESANKVLTALQNAYGAAPTSVASKPTAPAYKPSTPAQKAVYEKAKVLPHAREDSARWLESSTGVMIKSRLRTDTAKIPGDFYAKTVSAYGSDPNNGMQSAVDKVMSDYSQYTRSTILAPEENKVVGAYKDGDYHDMNNPLIKNKGKLTTPRQKILQAAIKKCHVPADTPSWRGMSASLQDLSGFDDAEHSVGRCFEHYNFASCSRNRDTSSGFGDKVMLHFTVPAGVHGLTVDGSGEREIVLPARSMFRIDKVEQNPTGYGGTAKHIVYCTYLGEREDE